MTVTLNLSPDIEASLVAQAQAEGLPIDQFLSRTLETLAVRTHPDALIRQPPKLGEANLMSGSTASPKSAAYPKMRSNVRVGMRTAGSGRQRMRILVDTNILLRAIDRSQPLSVSARAALKHLHAEGTELCLTSQIVREFWNVCTRPAKERSGLGLSVDAADRHTRMIERLFTVLPDLPEAYTAWRKLVVRHGVSGAKVHDADIVAAMLTHQVMALLTFDVGDFARYPQIQYPNPETCSLRYLLELAHSGQSDDFFQSSSTG